MKRLLLGFLVIITLLGGCTSIKYESGRPGIYKNEGIKRVAVLGFGHEQFTDEVLERLVGRSKWQLIDRFTLDKILREQDLQHGGRFDKGTAVRIGKLSGVDMVIFGTYYGSKATLKAIDVETAEYLKYKTISFSGMNSIGFKAAFLCAYLMPWKIKYINGQEETIWVGNDADVE